ncbi:MAG: hypothetical protein ACR2RF_33380 [Geminicoccaceae bacterium]
MADDDFSILLRISDRTAPNAKKWLLSLPPGSRQAEIRRVLELFIASEADAGWPGRSAPTETAPERKGWQGLKDDADKPTMAKPVSRVK